MRTGKSGEVLDGCEPFLGAKHAVSLEMGSTGVRTHFSTEDKVGELGVGGEGDFFSVKGEKELFIIGVVADSEAHVFRFWHCVKLCDNVPE